MEALNATSLSEVMMRCRLYPEYKAVIAIGNRSRFRDFLNSMKEYLRDDGSDDISSISRAGIIKFKNGSYIRPVTSDSKARGICAHEIIYDDDIGEAESIAERIRKIIYHCHEEEPEPETLDDFLSEFKIL